VKIKEAKRQRGKKLISEKNVVAVAVSFPLWKS